VGLAAIRMSSVARFHQGDAFQPWLEARGPYVDIAKISTSIMQTSSWNLTNKLASLVF
jgi:hypothetical protein